MSCRVAPPVRPRVKWKHYNMAINEVRLDGVNESAKNVPRRFRLLVDIVRDGEVMMPIDLNQIRLMVEGRLIVQLPYSSDEQSRSCWGIAMAKRR